MYKYKQNYHYCVIYVLLHILIDSISVEEGKLSFFFKLGEGENIIFSVKYTGRLLDNDV